VKKRDGQHEEEMDKSEERDRGTKGGAEGQTVRVGEGQEAAGGDSASQL